MIIFLTTNIPRSVLQSSGAKTPFHELYHSFMEFWNILKVLFCFVIHQTNASKEKKTCPLPTDRIMMGLRKQNSGNSEGNLKLLIHQQNLGRAPLGNTGQRRKNRKRKELGKGCFKFKARGVKTYVYSIALYAHETDLNHHRKGFER